MQFNEQQRRNNDFYTYYDTLGYDIFYLISHNQHSEAYINRYANI